MAEKSFRQTREARIRSTALKHAFSIEQKKKLKDRVADLVLKAYELPRSPKADPARPTAGDAALFQECLSLFQPSDLDDLVQERNIDNRCGYALCPKPNRKMLESGDKIWNGKGGQDFRIVTRAEMERWCSKACGNRATFVRAQLSLEPSWLRETQNEVRLLDEIGPANDLEEAARLLAKLNVSDDVSERLQALSLERGEISTRDVSEQVSVIENPNTGRAAVAPSRGDQVIEGHRPRKVRFS